MGNESKGRRDERQGVYMVAQVHGERKRMGGGMHGETGNGRW